MMSSSVVNASYAHAQQGAAPSLHTQPGHHRPPGTMQKPGIPAQQMQRKGKREWACGSGNGPEPTRGARAHAPQPRSIAWGKVQEKQRRTLLVRVFWKGSGNGSSDVVISPPEAGGCCPRWPRKCVPKLRLNLRPKFCGKKEKGDRQTTRLGQWSNYRQQFRATSKVRGAPPPA